MTATRLVLACQCGAALHGFVDPFEVAADLAKAFRAFHQGPGHGEATLAEARNSRRRAQRERGGT